MRTIHRRLAALTAGAAIALSGLASAPATADPSPSAASGSSWLAGELTNGLMHNPNYGGFDDYGLSIDTAFAELAVGNTAAAAQVRDAMAGHIEDYLTFGDPTSLYAGAAAKALVFAQRTGADPTSYGGRNLVTTVEGRISGAAGSEGRLVDMFSPPSSDTANTIGQTFAVRGLAAAGSAKTAAATAYLLRQQCPAGFFRLALGDAQCADNGSPDTDVTAVAMLNLQSLRAVPQVNAALAKATSWLESTQGADGSFGGGGLTAAPNTNSTGLAAATLGEQCAVTAADRAAAYVRALQVPAGQTGPLAPEVGAVAYDPAARTQGQADGITDDSSDQWRRATTQAVLGMTWDPKATPTVQVSGPQGFVKGGDTAAVTITGASLGERVCVTDSAGDTATLTGTGAPLRYEVRTARKGGDITVSATTGPGVASDGIQVLGKDRLRPKVSKTVIRGHRVPVKVSGLGAQEKVRVHVDGRLVAKGKATKKGVFKGHFLARLKVGKHRLTVAGQFKTRAGATTFRVVP